MSQHTVAVSMSDIASGVRSHPRIAAGTLTAFVGLSAMNVLPPAGQAALYALGLLAVLQRPRYLPPVIDILLIVLAVSYVGMLRSINGAEFGGAFRALRPGFEGLLIAHVLFKWCRIRTLRQVVIVLTGFVGLQFLVSLTMAANPTARLDFIANIYSDESYQGSQFAGALLFRGYGLSRHHLYGLPLACGLSAALALLIASIDKRGRHILGLMAVVAMVVVAVNARIGFSPVVISYVAGLLLLRDGFFAKHLTLTICLVIVPLLLLGAAYFGDEFEAVSTWLIAGVSQFGGGDQADSNTLSDLKRMAVVSPQFSEVLFGIGQACTGDEACYSDIGFVRAIQEGGLLFLTLIVAFYVRMGRHAGRLLGQSRVSHGQRYGLAFAVIMHATFIAAMVKGEAFGANDYSRLVAALGCLGLLASTSTRGRPVAAPLQYAT